MRGLARCGALAVAATLACGEGSGPSTPPPASVSGCYAITLGPWSGPHTSIDPLSPLVLLDSTGTYLFENGRTLLRPWPTLALDFFDMAWWSQAEPDRLTLMYSASGYVGIRIDLRWRDAWVGKAEAYTDIVPPIEATASAQLDSIPCAWPGRARSGRVTSVVARRER